MNLGDFKRKIQRLNPKLRIIARDTGKPAGINLLVEGEYVNICSIDKGEIPKESIRDSAGHYIKGGWRRAIKILIDKRLIDRRKAEQIFGCGMLAPNPQWSAEKDAVWQEIKELKEKRRRQNKGFSRTDILDMASIIRSSKKEWR